MAKGNDKNYVSFWFWFFALLVLGLPCIGIVVAVIFAFVGENESRKNYFRAVLAWAVISLILALVIISLGMWPEIQKQIQQWTHTAR